MTFDISKVSKIDGDWSRNGTRIYTYNKPDETLAAIKANGYFNTWENLRTNDLISIIASNGIEVVYVVSIYVASVTDAVVADWPTVEQENEEIVTAGTYETEGGSTSEIITLPGVVNTDRVFVCVKTFGTTPVSTVGGAPGTDNVTLGFNIDPSDDHEISYVILREVT